MSFKNGRFMPFALLHLLFMAQINSWSNSSSVAIKYLWKQKESNFNRKNKGRTFSKELQIFKIDLLWAQNPNILCLLEEVPKFCASKRTNQQWYLPDQQSWRMVQSYMWLHSTQAASSWTCALCLRLALGIGPGHRVEAKAGEVEVEFESEVEDMTSIRYDNYDWLTDNINN